MLSRVRLAFDDVCDRLHRGEGCNVHGALLERLLELLPQPASVGAVRAVRRDEWEPCHMCNCFARDRSCARSGELGLIGDEIGRASCRERV